MFDEAKPFDRQEGKRARRIVRKGIDGQTPRKAEHPRQREEKRYNREDERQQEKQKEG